MSELAPLIEDLAFILVLAGIVTIFCKKFNQPLVLGYILAGFFASPHFNLLPNVVDTANITVWSDIGVIFILFNLGLDFNFAKIKSIGGTALIAAVTELTGITLLGYACARLLGWQPIDSFFAGAMLTMSSTAVVSKTFEELGLLKERFTQFTFGILVLEDISGIIMIDFINMKDEKQKEKLLLLLENECRKDRIHCNVVDMTALNLVEMTRSKVRRPLLEQITVCRKMQKN